jgi:predicted ester cyclase
MCVDPRRMVRAAAVFGSAGFIVAALACGGAQPREEAAGTAPEAPRVLTAAERAAWYQECWAHFNAKDWDRYRSCYADNVESEEVDSGHPVARGIEAAVAVTMGVAEGFPDIKGTAELILVKGDTIVSIYLLNGTHTGSLLGPDGVSIPPTNKPIGLYQAHLVQVDASGNKVVKEQYYLDSGTMLSQIGVNPAPARPVAQSAAAQPVVVIAAGTPAELSNVDLLRAQMAAYNSHDATAVSAYSAPDFVYHDMATPADQTAKESHASTVEFFKAFPDARLAPGSAWGAGDYVVVTGRFEGTNTGAMPSMGVQKPTGNAVSARYLDISRWEDGKVTEEWLFYDGMAITRQLGLLKK